MRENYSYGAVGRICIQNTYTHKNIVVEWLTPVLHIQEIPVSNLCPEIGYPGYGLREFSQSLQINSRVIFKLGHDPSTQILSKSLFSEHSVIRCYTS
jgi:hypothetical protein